MEREQKKDQKSRNSKYIIVTIDAEAGRDGEESRKERKKSHRRHHHHRRSRSPEQAKDGDAQTDEGGGATIAAISGAAAEPQTGDDGPGFRQTKKEKHRKHRHKRRSRKHIKHIKKPVDESLFEAGNSETSSYDNHQNGANAVPHVVVNAGVSRGYFGSIMKYVQLVFKASRRKFGFGVGDDERMGSKRRRRRRGGQATGTESSIVFAETRNVRKAKLNKLLRVLETMDDQYPEESEMIPDLRPFGIPEQTKLCDVLFESDYRKYDFGSRIQVMFSPVLRSWVPINTSNTYVSASKYLPALNSMVYHGIDTHPSEFAEDERRKAEDQHRQLEELKSVAVDEEHYDYLKDLVIKQMSSLPLSIMYGILHEQINVVRKYTEVTVIEHRAVCNDDKLLDVAACSRALGGNNVHTKTAQVQLTRLRNHATAFAKLGVSPLPPLSILRKYQQTLKEENWDVTPTSSSDSEKELESVLHHKLKISQKERELAQTVRDDNIILGILRESLHQKINDRELRASLETGNVPTFEDHVAERQARLSEAESVKNIKKDE